MTKHKFLIGDKTLTSLVMNPEEFVTLIAQVTGLLSDEQISEIQAAGHLPLVARGTKTETLFDFFDIDTELMSAIIRGKGQNMLDKNVVNLPTEEVEKLTQQTEKLLSGSEKDKIENMANKVYETIANGGDPSKLVISFVHDNGQMMTQVVRNDMVERTLMSLAVMLWKTRQQLDQEAWEVYFSGYVRRLLIGIYSAMISFARN